MPASTPQTDERRSSYDALAPFYERHWAGFFIDSAKRIFLDMLAGRIGAGSRVLDLCCGTGEFSAWLDSHGMWVVGIDHSAPMLRRASARVPDGQFYQADMARFRVPLNFSAVTCFYNSLNHALSLSELRHTFSSVHHHLKEGGWFLFDFVDEEGYQSSWDSDEVVRSEDRICELRYRYDWLKATALCHARIVEPGKRDVEVILRQRPFSIFEIEAELERAGFAVVLVRPVLDAIPARGRFAVLAQAIDTSEIPIFLQQRQLASTSFRGEPVLALRR